MDKLAILWISGEKEIALDMVLMYTLKANVNKWWDECHLITCAGATSPSPGSRCQGLCMQEMC